MKLTEEQFSDIEARWRKFKRTGTGILALETDREALLDHINDQKVELEALFAAMRERLNGAVIGQWQPMAAAPKDRDIIVLTRGGVCRACWAVLNFDEDDYWWVDTDHNLLIDDVGGVNEPLGWVPVPEGFDEQSSEFRLAPRA